MLRSTVGWVRHADEDWATTMKRLKQRATMALHMHPVDIWTSQLFAFQILQLPSRAAAAAAQWFLGRKWQGSFASWPHRRPGRALKKWDDRLRSFVAGIFPNVEMWIEIAGDACWLPYLVSMHKL